jgi:hypothetical protein
MIEATELVITVSAVGVSQFKVPENATGPIKIETGGPAQGGFVDSASGGSTGSHGGPYQSVNVTAAPGSVFNLYLEGGTPYNSDGPPSVGCTVVDATTNGDHINIASGWGYVGGYEPPTVSGDAVAMETLTQVSGQPGQSVESPDADGGANGGDSGGPPGDVGVGGTGATATANGTSGQFPGGGGSGGTSTHPGGMGAGGFVRFTIGLNVAKPQVVVL